MSNKGFTVMELSFTIAITGIIILIVFSIPSDLLRIDANHSKLLAKTEDLNNLKHFIILDLMKDNIDEEDGKLTIGNSIYMFGENVKRDGKVISDSPYEYTLENNYINIYNDDFNVKLNTKSSFTRE